MMGPLEWKAYLQECSYSIVDGPEDGTPLLSEAVLRSGWLGYDGASRSAIWQAESRLGVTLPPSLRAFYSASNGWRTVGCFIYQVLPVEKIGWLPETDPILQEVLGGSDLSQDAQAEDNYHYKQMTRVKRSLIVSVDGDASTWLLDPGTVNTRGKWAGGRWSSWNPAMEWIADSFEELFRDEHKTYLRLRARN